MNGVSESQAQAIRAELRTVLASAAFRTSKRCRGFLEYIVKHTIEGPPAALKERSIGVELFQLPSDFDTGQRTVVRVTANEVRKKIAQYYVAETGSFHPVRIDLPPGSYSAEFTFCTPAEPPAPAEPPVPAQAAPTPRAKSGWLLPIAACITVTLVLAGAVALARWRAPIAISADAKSPVFDNVVARTAPIAGVRMIAGSLSQYVDRSGRAWGPDQFFSGGNALVRPSERVLRTLDPDIYRHLRSGDFRYDIPLEPGNYELHLHFAETGLADFISAESTGEGNRLFRVSVNNKMVLDSFDVVADSAGANIADERVFRNVSPARDGFLHLSFESLRSTAMISAIEVLPVRPGTVRPVRIRAGWTSSWQDAAGQQWQADSYYIGGNALARMANPVHESHSTGPGTALYTSERWGHFSYAIPVADGRYRVTLRFSEGQYGKQSADGGSRVFDVFCNGVALLKDFDIHKEAGGEGLPIDRKFSGIRPNAQGKIILTFVPVTGMAGVNGIEVTEEAR